MNQIENAITKIKQIHKSQPLKNISNTPLTNKPLSLKSRPDIFDTTFNDALCDLFKSSQYKKEVAESFDCVEKTICLMGNNELEKEFNLTMNESVFNKRNKVEELLEKTFKSPQLMKKVLQHANESVNLNKDQIEWTDESFLSNADMNFSKTDNSISKLLKDALSDNINKTLTQSNLQNKTLHEKDDTEEDKFIRHGDFFALPDRVKDLFKVYKGINKLYGNLIINMLFIVF